MASDSLCEWLDVDQLQEFLGECDSSFIFEGPGFRISDKGLVIDPSLIRVPKDGHAELGPDETMYSLKIVVKDHPGREEQCTFKVNWANNKIQCRYGKSAEWQEIPNRSLARDRINAIKQSSDSQPRPPTPAPLSTAPWSASDDSMDLHFHAHRYAS